MTLKINSLSPQVLPIATVTVSTFFIWQGNIGFSLWDEGYHWYGVQRVMQGEVPMRDFMAYDPGRYYWSAVVMGLLGDNGIMALRFSSMLFEMIGIFVGLLLIANNVKKQDYFYLSLSAITLLMWMMMSFKVADYVASIVLIGALAFLVQNPTSTRYFVAGCCVGLAAFFGRNHGVYGVIGSAWVMLYLNINKVVGVSQFKVGCYWVTGVAVGYVPMFFMMLFIPGFTSAFWESILVQIAIGGSTLPLPLPWPWLVNFAVLPIGEAIRGVVVGIFFIVILVFGFVSIARVFWCKFQDRPASPVLVASSFLMLPYAHYSYSRADVAHLSLGIFPFLIGCLAVFAAQPNKFKWTLAIILCASSLWVMHVHYPGWQCYISKHCIKVEISGDEIILDQVTANDVAFLHKLANEYAPDGQSFIAVPLWPGAYSLLGRKSPMWEIFALISRSPKFQQTEIERIQKVKPSFAIVYDYPLDGREELRYQNTHPLIYQYIQENFDRLPDSPNPAYQIYTAKGNG